MKKVLLFLFSFFLLTAQAETTITFQTDQTGVFAVVALASSEEVSSPPAFMITSTFTDYSITYTLTPTGESP